MVSNSNKTKRRYNNGIKHDIITVANIITPHVTTTTTNNNNNTAATAAAITISNNSMILESWK